MNKFIKILLILISLIILYFFFFSPENTKEITQNNLKLNERPQIENIGVNLDYYDPKTNKAGDFEFTKAKLHDNSLFMNYGHFIPANSEGGDKYNPQPTFILPMGTEVFSLVDGVVVGIPKLYSNDYSVMVSKNKGDTWVYELEHVTNVKVKVGDKVKAGQVLAEVSPHDSKYNNGMGLFEIGILKGGNPPQHVCPFDYLNPKIQKDIFAKMMSFYKSWEEYKGDSFIYDEQRMKVPGCMFLEPIEG